jgi:hypothetical protein
LDPGIRTRSNFPNANFWRGNGEARFSPDGRFLITWEMAAPVHVWDAQTGRLLHTLPHDERCDHVSFCTGAPALLATACRGVLARVWDLPTGKLVVALQHPSTVIRVRFSPDGTELISCGGDGMLRVWDWRAGNLKEALLLDRESGLLMDFGFSADRHWLIALGTADLQLVDWRTKALAGPLWNLKPYIQLALEIPVGDRRAVVGGFSGSLVGYDLNAMVTPTTAPVAELVRLAEVVAGRRIMPQGNVAPLSSAEWDERWQRLHRSALAAIGP